MVRIGEREREGEREKERERDRERGVSGSLRTQTPKLLHISLKDAVPCPSYLGSFLMSFKFFSKPSLVICPLDHRMSLQSLLY